MQVVATFDPAAQPGNSFANPLPNGIGTLVFYNDSGVTIDATWNSNTQILPAGMIDAIKICEPAQLIQWQQDYILTNVSSWPASVVKVVGYRPDEQLPYAAFPVPLQRTSNVGNSIPVSTSATSIVNDGNAANTQVIETTPTGQSSSAFVLDNMGNLTLRTLDNNVWSIVISIIQSAIAPATKLFHGTADKANSVSATGVTAGALPAGVTSPNYMPFSGGTFTGNVTFNSSSTAEFDATANFDKAGGGGDAVLAQFQASDQSPAARWTLQQRASDGALYFVDNTNGFHSMFIRTNSGDPFNGVSFFSGSSSGTVSHGFGATPSWIGITDNTGGSSMTVGAASIGSTTVAITTGAAHAWLAVAM